jgi:hypothetical protein
LIEIELEINKRKNTNMKKAIYLCVILTMLFVACKKESQEAPKSTRELLVEKKWYQTAILINPALMGMTNMYDSLIPCQKDDIFTYRNTGKMEIDNGILKCNTGDPQIDSATLWKLQDNKLIQSIDIGSRILSDTMDIELIDNQHLNLGISIKYGKNTYKYLYKYETR